MSADVGRWFVASRVSSQSPVVVEVVVTPRLSSRSRTVDSMAVDFSFHHVNLEVNLIPPPTCSGNPVNRNKIRIALSIKRTQMKAYASISPDITQNMKYFHTDTQRVLEATRKTCNQLIIEF